MKQIRYITTILFSALVLFACNKPEPETPAKLSASMDKLEFGPEGGTATLTITSNKDWQASSSADWVTLSSRVGSANASVTVTVAATEDGERSAQITITNGLTNTMTVLQKGATAEGLKSATIGQFRAASPDQTWYQLTGTIASIASEEYGNLYIYDDTGYVYVYGLTEDQVEKNDKSFSHLSLKVGDKVTIAALRTTYNGIIEAGGNIPAYYIRHNPGEYKYGFKASSTKAGWLELPKTSDTDSFDYLCHYNTSMKRSYSLYWDYENLVARWVAYPLNKGLIASGDRTDSWALDPLLPRDKQAFLAKAYTSGNNGSYDRGHQLPSADRLNYRDNIQTFYGTNSTPQSNSLNGTGWENIEQSVRSWSKAANTDTLYVVTGCDIKDSKFYVYDNDLKKVTVPVGYFKAVLRYSAKDGYKGLALYVKNEKLSGGGLTRDVTMSIDELEEKLGYDFFYNLDDATEKTVEAAKPADDQWWWDNK